MRRREIGAAEGQSLQRKLFSIAGRLPPMITWPACGSIEKLSGIAAAPVLAGLTPSLAFVSCP